MERAITGFVQDEAGDWVALLECLHRQHLRHNPPFRSAPWVLDKGERQKRIGAPLDCPLCDRAELPGDLLVVRTTDTWTEDTMPAGLRRAHRVAAGTWGRLVIESGELRFRANTEPALDTLLRAGDSQPIPPGVEHDVEPQGSVRFLVEFLRPAPPST